MANWPQTFLHNRLTIALGCMNYCLKAGEIPGVDGAPTTVLAAVIVHDEVIAKGTASSGRSAKVKASEAALAVLEGLPAFRFREKYGCDCQKAKKDGEPETENGAVGTAV